MGYFFMRSNLERTGAQFQTTEWTILQELKCSNESRQRSAAEHLAKRYWPPVFAWLRQKGLPADKAAETTQGFFEDVVLARRLFERADMTKGRLRDWLKTSLKNYLTDCHRSERRQLERFQYESDVLELEERFQTRNACVSPDEAFDKRWALSILEQAIEECERHFGEKNHPEYWSAFNLWVLQPALYGNLSMPRDEIAQQLGFSDEGHVSVAVHTVKQRLKAVIEQTVARTVSDPADSRAEYESIQAMLM